jgi:hypothetical protein
MATEEQAELPEDVPAEPSPDQGIDVAALPPAALPGQLGKAPANPKSKWGMLRLATNQVEQADPMKRLRNLPPPPHTPIRPVRSVPTKNQMLEYLNVLAWAESSSFTFPQMFILWVVFVYIVHVRSLVEMSYEIKSALIGRVEGVVVPHNVLLEIARQDMDQSSESALSQCRCLCTASEQHVPKDACTSIMGAQQLDFVSWVPRSIVKDPMNAAIAAANNHFDAFSADAAGLLASTLGWHNITSVKDLQIWMQHAYLPRIWAGRTNAHELRLQDWNLLIGGVRARQRRRKRDECTFDDDIKKFHTGACYSSELSEDAFGDSSRTTPEIAGGFSGSEADKTAFDIHLDAAATLDEVMAKCQSLWNADWLDGDTQSLELQAGLLNVEAGIFGKLVVGLTFKTGGRIERYFDVQLQSCLTLPLLELIPELIWCLMIFTLLVVEIRQIWKAKKNEELAEYATDFWNLLDWFSIFLGVGIGVFWFILNNSTQSVAAEIAGLPKYSDVPIDEYHKKWSSVLDSMDGIFLIQMIHRLGLFWYTLVLMMRFFKAFLGQPRLALMTSTLFHCLNDMTHLLIIFAVLFFNFSLGGYVMFGTRLEKWSSLSQSIHTAWLAMFGRFDLEDMFAIAPVSTTIWFWLFMLSMIFVVNNMFFSVIYDHYNTMNIKTGSTVGMFWQMADGLDELGYNLRWRNDTRKNDGLKAAIIGPVSKNELLDGWLGHVKATADERQACQQSSIGLRLFRKRQADYRPAHEKVLEQDVEVKPLQSIGLDKESALRLIHKCMQYTKKVQDPHDGRLAQLQDFVDTVNAHLHHVSLRCTAIEEDVRDIVQPLIEKASQLENEIRLHRDDLLQMASTTGVRVAAAPPPRAVDAEASYNFSNWQKIKDGISSMMLTGTM